MKKIIYLIVIMSSMAFLFVGCGKTELCPLKPGNLWIYNNERFDSTGAVETSGYLYQTVFVDSVINNELFYYKKSESFFGKSEFYANNSSGMNVLAKTATSMLEFKYPVSVGEQFLRRERDTIHVTSVDEKVKTPSGEYSCIKYEAIYYTGKEVYCFSPGVGLISKESYMKTDDKFTLVEKLTLIKVFLK